MNTDDVSRSGARGPFIGVPGYWHESEAILGNIATAVPDSYLRALVKSGAIPLIIPVVSSTKVLAQLFRMIDGLLLIGGPDLDPVHYHQKPLSGLRKITPPRDAVEIQVTRWALDAHLPILAICRGVQVLNVVAGGTLWQDIGSQLPDAEKHDYYPDHPKDFLAHNVKLLPDSRLARIVGDTELAVNSLHHQAIDRLGKGFLSVAHSPDGIIEAVEGAADRWVIGVQWHPEWLVENDDRMVALFRAFCETCIERGKPALSMRTLRQ